MFSHSLTQTLPYSRQYPAIPSRIHPGKEQIVLVHQLFVIPPDLLNNTMLTSPHPGIPIPL